jgi:hypothetical protein
LSESTPTCRLPISASAAVTLAEIEAAVAPAAMLSFAAISWWARMMSPLPPAGSLRIESSSAAV